MTAVPTHPWMDGSRAPIFVWTYPETATVDEVAEYWEAMYAWYITVDEPIGVIVNTSRILQTDAQQRSITAKGLERTAPYSSKWVAGCGIVVPNAFARGLVTATFWLRKPGFPYRLFESPGSAHDWVGEMVSVARARHTPSDSD